MENWILVQLRVSICGFLVSTAMIAAGMLATSGKPVLLRVNYQGGHGSIGGTKAQVEELLADQWSFLLWQFGSSGFQPANPASVK